MRLNGQTAHVQDQKQGPQKETVAVSGGETLVVAQTREAVVGWREGDGYEIFRKWTSLADGSDVGDEGERHRAWPLVFVLSDIY